MTSAQIKIMLHYQEYATTDYVGSVDESLEKSAAFLVHNEMLRMGDAQCKPRYLITTKGTAYVTMIRSVPIPIVQFVDPRFEK